uniref:TSA: Wollemia nobilis Ref_Wollemi_Transcript_8074_1374 transcribed RNA sequence n=1 Tax=Wollemia nobilis TaxID=56998 RepID=A0A0C9QUS7_9CONI
MADAEQVSNPNDSTSVAHNLLAPPGWKKKLVPKKSGTPTQNTVVFIAPTGDELNTKRSLERYLKSNPGGPSITEFDWSTGEITPTRRSARISEKVKESPVKTAENESKKKPRRARKSQGESEDVEKQEAEKEEGQVEAAKNEKMEDAQQGKETLTSETGKDAMEEEKKGNEKYEEGKPELMQEEIGEESKTAGGKELAEKGEEEKSVVKPEIHSTEGEAKECLVAEIEENLEKHKNLDKKNENGCEGTGPVENYNQERYPEPLKELHEPIDKAKDMDTSSNNSEAKQPSAPSPTT